MEFTLVNGDWTNPQTTTAKNFKFKFECYQFRQGIRQTTRRPLPVRHSAVCLRLSESDGPAALGATGYCSAGSPQAGVRSDVSRAAARFICLFCALVQVCFCSVCVCVCVCKALVFDPQTQYER